MKALILVACVLCAFVAQAQEYEVGMPAFAQWGKWSEEELTARRIVRVEIEVDGVPLEGLPPVRPIPDEPLYEHQIPQNLLTIGPHLVRGRPCSPTECGGWIEVHVTYRSLLPGLLKQFQIHMKDLPIVLPVAADMVRHYGGLFGYEPTDEDLRFLATQFTGELNRFYVLRFLEDTFTKLVK